MNRNRQLACLVVWLLAAPAHGEGIGWRGDGSGRYAEATPPSAWDIEAGKNIAWRAKIGKGQSTPIVVGDKVFVTAGPDKLLALDRRSGKVLWTADNGYAALPTSVKAPEEAPPTAEGCGYATPTPVSDGKLIYAVFGTGIVASYDLDGNRKWIRYLDLPQVTQYGRAASPVLAAGKLLVSLSGLTALEPQTGNVLWNTPEAKCSYGTPAVARIGDVDVAITPTGDCVRVADGRILARRLAVTKYSSPLVVGGIVYFADATTVAVRLPEKPGETIKPERLWENDEIEGEVFASPVCHEGTLYCASNDGVLYALDARSGKIVYQKELEIRSAGGRSGEPANVYPSLVLAGRHLLLANDAGETLVLMPGNQYQEIARNCLDKGAGASPVPDGQLLLLRSGASLYGIGPR